MHSFTKIFQPHLIALTETQRKAKNYSQEKMADALHITPRSYSSIKHGKQSLSASSLLFLLLTMSDEDILAFVQQIRSVVNDFEKENL